MNIADVVIVSDRGSEAVIKTLIDASNSPERWVKNHFIVVCPNGKSVAEIEAWVQEHKHEIPLPRVTAKPAPAGTAHNRSALRQYGVELGENPFVYFHGAEAPLPEGFGRRMKVMLKEKDVMAVYGSAQTLTERGRVVETFPQVAPDGSFIVPPLEACKYFPTYAHSLAALFRRSVFDKIPLFEGKRYFSAGEEAYMVRLLFSKNIELRFMPDVIRYVIHQGKTDEIGFLDENKRKDLAQDIMNWKKFVKNKEIEEFQEKVAKRLSKGVITTYREIGAMVEAQMLEKELY